MFLMPTLLADTNLFLWVDLERPTPEETKFVLEDVFHFHPLSIEDCVMLSPSPKVEEYTPKEEDTFAPYLFMVIHGVDYSRKDGVFATSELNFFLGKNFLVTYHEVPLRSVQVTSERCLKSTVHIARAPDRVAHTLLDSIVENYKPALEELSLEIGELEQQALQNPTRETLNKILQVKKEVLHLRQIIGPQREVLARFRQQGFRIAVDDVGTGYSSLASLADIEPDYLKFDNVFVRGIDRRSSKQDLLEALLSFARKMNTQVIAEGIENEQELKTLRSLRVPFGQGFLLGRPMPIAEIENVRRLAV